MAAARLLIVSPVRNEAAHIEPVAAAIAAQVRRPDRWLVVDDGSSDGTSEILQRLSCELEFMEVVATPPGFTREAADRLAVAAAPRAFNFGLDAVDVAGFTHIGKLDGDVELRPNYYDAILEEFARNPALGIAGGVILERRGGRWLPTRCAADHVRGAIKVYSRECFEAIGGIEERLGWDGIDSTVARMRGFRTRSFGDIEALHHRHTGSADGRLRGHVRWGEAHWILHHGIAWTVLRAGKVARLRPGGLSGVAYLYGYARAAARRMPRVQVEGYRRFVRAEQRRRMVERLRFRRGRRSEVAAWSERKKAQLPGVRP
jgi:poly-beta-1,6-N-acetyl-D-glucosamine synthase